LAVPHLEYTSHLLGVCHYFPKVDEMLRAIFMLAVIGLVFDSAGAEELILVNKKSGVEISLLKAGVEFELEGEVYVVQESKSASAVFTTPEEALDAYFSCQEWVDRIPLVVNSERAGKLMAKYYTGEFSLPKFVKIDSKPKLKSENPKIYIYKVIVGASEAEYVVQETKAGYKVDWEESQTLWKLAKVRKHKVENAEFVVMLTTKKGVYDDWTKLRLNVWNNSKAFIGRWHVDLSFYDTEKEYLGQTSVVGKNLKPGGKMFEEESVTDIKAADIDSWSIKLSAVFLDNPDPDAETLIDAAKYYKLKEVKKKN